MNISNLSRKKREIKIEDNNINLSFDVLNSGEIKVFKENITFNILENKTTFNLNSGTGEEINNHHLIIQTKDIEYNIYSGVENSQSIDLSTVIIEDKTSNLLAATPKAVYDYAMDRNFFQINGEGNKFLDDTGEYQDLSIIDLGTW